MIQKRVIFPILSVVFANFVAMVLVFPLLPFYAQIFDATATQIGFLGSTFAICQLIASPILGKMSDRYGRKPVLLLSQIGGIVGLLIMIFAQQLWVLFLARAIEGMTAGSVAVAQAYVADTTKPHERSQAFGLVGATFGVSLLFGSAVSGFLADYDLHYPIYLAVVFMLISVLGTLFILPKTKKPDMKGTSDEEGLELQKDSVFIQQPGVPLFQAHPDLFSWLVIYFLFVFIFSYYIQGFAIFSQAFYQDPSGAPFGPKEVGFLFSYFGAIGILVQGGMINTLVHRFGEQNLVRMGFFLDGMGYVLMTLTPSFAALILGTTLFSVGNSLLRPAIMGLISQKIDDSQQGYILGVTSSLQSLGQVLAPPIGGYILQHYQPGVWAVLLSAFAFFALGATQIKIRINRVAVS